MGGGGSARRALYQVIVHVDAAVLADSDAPGQSVVEGARVSAETSQRLACDASRVVMRHDADGKITEVGARTRTIPPALRRALEHRDRGCRFLGCGSRFGQGHHRAVHEEGYQVTLEPSGELSFQAPGGRLLDRVPAPPAAAANPIDERRAHNDARGFHIDAHTSMPSWQGERLDLDHAIAVLHPLAVNARP